MRILSLLIGLSLAGFVSAEDAVLTTGPAFQNWLSLPADKRPALAEQPFASAALTKEQALKANELLWKDHLANVRAARAEEMDKKEIVHGADKLRFEFKIFGKKPESGRSLYISMHGGGNTQPKVNDKQWQNQIGLYEPEEGIYLAPRAPSDTWNLWHKAHIDPLFDRLIENLIILEDVNPNKVYFMGYSAGGDGVYQ
ncbi:MAG: transglutaminase domain-containing protein, partial [Verrucomicrobiales bacterium]